MNTYVWYRMVLKYRTVGNGGVLKGCTAKVHGIYTPLTITARFFKQLYRCIRNSEVKVQPQLWCAA